MRDAKPLIRKGWGDFLPVAAVFAAGLSIPILVFITVQDHYKSVDQQKFQRDAAFYGLSFKSEVDRHVASLAAIRAFVSASRDVTRWQFSAFAHQILPQNSGFKAILWVPYVEHAQRKAFEAELQRDGLYGLHIRELNYKDELVDAGSRPYYLPVAFVQPFEGNGSIAGIDLSVDPVYARLFKTAQKTGQAAATPPVSRALVEATVAPIVIVAFPLNPSPSAFGHNSGQPAQGYALGVLQLNRVLEDSIASRTVALQAAIAYGDSSAANPVVADQFGTPITISTWRAGGKFNRTLPFDIAGQHFRLIMRSADRDEAITLFYVPLGSALLVLAISALLFQSMLATILRKRVVERAVEERTFELRELNAALNHEIEHRKETEAELRISKDKAEAASRSKSTFLSTMSHELRTPLNAIIGFSELLIQKPFREDRSKDYLSEIHGSGKKLLNLINDILDITQIDAEGTARFDVVEIPDIVAGALESVQPFADSAGVSLRSTVSNNLPSVLGDGRRLQKAIINLLSNSIKFGRRGGWAEVGVVLDSEFLVIGVSDNGVGIPPDAKTRIFELFSQSDTSFARKYEGIGLGLTFVRRVADLHGAGFRIKSSAGQGTTVTLTLPTVRPTQIADAA